MNDIEVGLRVKPLLDQAIQGLRQLRGEAQEAAKAGQQAGQAAQKAAATPPTPNAPGSSKPAQPQANKQVADEAAKAEAQLRREARALDELIGSLTPAASAAEKLAGAQQQLNAALASGKITQEQHTRLMAAAQQRFSALGVSAGQTAQAMRQLPAQITDIGTSLASGMPAWLVAIQQGGQIRDSFGSISGAAVGLVRTLGMLVNPWAILAGAAAGVAVAYNQGEKEGQRFEDGLILTGQAARVTGQELSAMAQRIGKSFNNVGDASGALAELVESGERGAETLELMGRAAVAMSQATGKSISSTVGEFAKLRGDPVKAVETLNEKYRFLTADVYAQIKALTEQGDKEAATSLAQTTLARALEQRAAGVRANMGTLEKAWDSLGKAARAAWDGMLNIGREKSLPDQIAEQQAKVDRARAVVESGGFGSNEGGAAFGRGSAALKRAQETLEREGAALAALQGAAAGRKANAEAIADAQDQQDARIQLDKERDKYLSGRAKLEKEHADNLARLNTQLTKANASDAERNTLIAQENARFQKELNSLPNPGLQNAKAQAELTAAQLRQNLEQLQAAITTGDAMVTYALEKGQVSIEGAYQARLAMISAESQAQREALRQERAELDKELKAAVKPDERAGVQKRIVEVETKAKLLDSSLAEATRKLGIWKTEQERSLATITAKIRVDVAGITGQFDRQAIQDQLNLQYQGDREAAGRIADPAEAAAERARIDLLVQAGAAQAEFNAKLAEAQRLQQAQAAIEAAIQQRVSTGQISQIEGEAKIQQARAAQVPLLQSIVDGLERIKGSVPTDAAATIDQMTTSIAEMRNAVAASTPVIVDWGTKAKNTAIDGLADAAANAVTQFSSLRDMVGDTLKNIAADLVRSDIKRLLTNLFKVDGGGGGGGGSFIGSLWSGARSLFGFAEGGQIRGPGTGTSDSIPALVDGVRPIAVSNEEYIQPVRAVKHYGTGFMEAVRTLRLPKPSTGYALGGLVQASQRARFATGGAVAAGSAAAGAGSAPNVVVQFTNTGTPQKAVRQSSSFEGRDLVVQVMLADAQAGGQITRSIGAALNRN